MGEQDSEGGVVPLEAETQGSGFARETPWPTNCPEATGPEPLGAAGKKWRTPVEAIIHMLSPDPSPRTLHSVCLQAPLVLEPTGLQPAQKLGQWTSWSRGQL